MRARVFIAGAALPVLLAGCSGGGTAGEQPAGSADTGAAAVPVEAGVSLPPGAVQAAQGDAGASGDSGEALPLSRGVYVLAGSGCDNPANAAIKVFDGRGLSGSTTRDCRAQVLESVGGRLTVENSCIDTYSGERTGERQVIAPEGREAFALETPNGASSYRLCPALDLADFGGAR